MKNSLVVTWGLLVLLSVAVLCWGSHPRIASALQTPPSTGYFYPGSACAQASPVTGSLLVSNGNASNTSATQSLTLYCPVTANGTSISGFSFFGYANDVAAPVQASLCTVSVGNGVPTCGATAWITVPNSTFYKDVDFSKYSNAQPNYLKVVLSNQSWGNNSVFGYAWSL